MLKVIILTLILSSCAHKNHQKTDDTNSIIDLAKASYIKGCVEGMNHIYQKKTYGKNLEICKRKSEKHKREIQEILSSKK